MRQPAPRERWAFFILGRGEGTVKARRCNDEWLVFCNGGGNSSHHADCSGVTTTIKKAPWICN